MVSLKERREGPGAVWEEGHVEMEAEMGVMHLAGGARTSEEAG